MMAIAAANLCTEQTRTHSQLGTGGVATMATPMAHVSLMRVTMVADPARLSARIASTMTPAVAGRETVILMASILELVARTAEMPQETDSLASPLSSTATRL